MTPRYWVRTFLVPEDLEDVFSGELWAAGTAGVQVEEGAKGRLRMAAYFTLPPGKADALRGWSERGVRELSCRLQEDRDWLADYRAHAVALEVGSRFLVDPGEWDSRREAGPSRERITLRIPAQSAFGTGSHESTQLAVEWLEEVHLEGLRVLDVGTGSGILAFAALRLGARSVLGFDIDAASVCIAHSNAALNELRPWLVASDLRALAPRPFFDLAVVNILPERILDQTASIARLLMPGGRVISSGNLAARRGEVLSAWAAAGLLPPREEPRGEKRCGEWTSFLLGRRP